MQVTLDDVDIYCHVFRLQLNPLYLEGITKSLDMGKRSGKFEAIK